MAGKVFTSEEKAGVKIADVISDLRVDPDLVGQSLGTSQPVEILNRLVEMVNGMYVSRERFRQALGHPASEVSVFPKVDADEYGTSFENRCNILGEFFDAYKDDEDYAELFQYADIGLPAAFLISSGFVSANASTVKFIDEAWAMLLERLGFDEYGSYECLEDVLG